MKTIILNAQDLKANMLNMEAKLPSVHIHVIASADEDGNPVDVNSKDLKDFDYELIEKDHGLYNNPDWDMLCLDCFPTMDPETHTHIRIPMHNVISFTIS